MNRRRADAEIFLHVGFSRRCAVEPRVEVDKGQILPLHGREGFCRRTHAGHPIQLFVRASNTEARHECTLSGRSQPNRAHGTQGAAQQRQACVAQAQASPDLAGRRCRCGRRGDREECRRGRLDRVPDQAPLRGGQSGTGAERRAASRGGTQTHGQGRSPAGSDGLRQSPGRPRPLDARAAGRRDGQAHRTQELVARDRSAALGRKWPQALAQGHVVHSAGRWRIRRPHGGRA